MAKGLKPEYPTKQGKAGAIRMLNTPNPKVRDSGLTAKPLPAGQK